MLICCLSNPSQTVFSTPILIPFLCKSLFSTYLGTVLAGVLPYIVVGDGSVLDQQRTMAETL